MGKVNSFLAERLKMATQKFSKMTDLAEMTSSGQLSSFSGVFRVANLTEKEQQSLQEILKTFRKEEQDIQEDLLSLSFHHFRSQSDQQPSRDSSWRAHQEGPRDSQALSRGSIYSLAHRHLWQPPNSL